MLDQILGSATWQMSPGERAALTGVLAAQPPRLAIEIGTGQGGSLRCIAAFAERTLAFDARPPAPELAELRNVTFHTGNSHVLLPKVLAELEQQGQTIDFVLVDGDHSAGGVKRDIEDLLNSGAVSQAVIALHDTANPEVRKGLEAVRYDAWAKVRWVDLDWVPGFMFREGPARGEAWSGLGIILVDQERGPAADYVVARHAIPVPELLDRFLDGDARSPGSNAAAERARPPTSVEVAAQREATDHDHIRRLIAFTLAPDSNCIDVGAHRGAILEQMQRAAPAGAHIAFEPLPHLCAFLRERFPQVDVHEAALSNHTGEGLFAYVHGRSEGWSGLRFRPLPTGEEVEVEQIGVELEVLDQVLDPAYRPALIKIDVEGAEQQVIEGALATLRRHKPIVIFEHGLGSADAFGTQPRDIYRLLRNEAGLRLFDLDGNGPYDLAGFERTYYAWERVNFVARP